MVRDDDDMSYYGSHEILTEWLVGKSIASISRSDDAKWVRFQDAHGRILDLYADGDCCSESYFVSIEKLRAAVDLESVEDGVTHPAEAELDLFVRENGAGPLMAYVERLPSPRHAAFIRLLGRLECVDPASRMQLVSRALASRDVEVRDAAIQAAETWSDASLAALLTAHDEPVAWLAAYRQQVVDDLMS